MGDMKDPNLIYPVGANSYIHIFPDSAEARNFYIAIEPGTDTISDLIEQVEFRLLDFVEILADATTPKKRRRCC